MGQLKKRTKQELECIGSADWDKLIARIPMCKIELTKQADAMRESGVVKSDRDAAKRIAELTGRKFNSVWSAIKRQRKELESGCIAPTKSKRQRKSGCSATTTEIKKLKQEVYYGTIKIKAIRH